MERYQIILAYDGTDFLGFQRQENNSRTVQLVVENALRALNWQGSTIYAAGRTDTGVHASGQVIAVDLDWLHSPEKLAKALNAHLPHDVAVREVHLAAPDFHPRYYARRRSYCYRMCNDPFPDPLRERYMWRVEKPLDAAAMQAAANELLGFYDCSAFGTPPHKGGSTMRKIYRAEWLYRDPSIYEFHVTANAFLYHMVRRMVFLLAAVGKGALRCAEFVSGVRESQPLPAGLAPAKGLALTEVDYHSAWDEELASKTVKVDGIVDIEEF